MRPRKVAAAPSARCNCRSAPPGKRASCKRSAPATAPRTRTSRMRCRTPRKKNAKSAGQRQSRNSKIPRIPARQSSSPSTTPTASTSSGRLIFCFLRNEMNFLKINKLTSNRLLTAMHPSQRFRWEKRYSRAGPCRHSRDSAQRARRGRWYPGIARSGSPRPRCEPAVRF